MQDGPSSEPLPDGLLDAFWSYERALMDDDLAAMDRLFEDAPGTMRGDAGGLLVGHGLISAFRRSRGETALRTVVDVQVRVMDDTHALVVAVTEARGGGRGLQTQLWHRAGATWAVQAAHVSSPPVTFDSAVWRVVGDPLVPGGEGPLAGERVAVKDLFAVAGHPVGAGVPAYLAEQTPAAEHATAVRRLVEAGASVHGIARTDQFAYSLAGDNEHYGAPVNPMVPGGLPGGSSSGSATAVSLGAATIGLGTDTAGSVRVPASYQGLWGLRTSHGSVPADGLLALAPSFDSVGLLSRSPEVLARSAAALLGGAGVGALREELLACPALHDLATPGVAASLREWMSAVSAVRDVELPDAAEVAESFRVHQAFEAWQVHGPWLTAHPGALRGAPRARFETARAVTVAEDEAAGAALTRARRQIDETLGDRVLVLASAASSAPRVWDSAERVDRVRSATMRLTCYAGVTGRPAVSVPVLTDGGDPVGLSMVGPRGSDLALVELARRLVPG